MHPQCKEQAKFKKILGYMLDVALALALFYAAVYLLRKGTIHYRPESQQPLGILTGLPFVLRPRKKATTPELLLHDVLVLLSASSFALLLTEYVVKGGILIGNTAIWQGFVYHAAIFGLVYVFVANIRLTACIGMGLTLVYALIDHYVTVFRGTPVLLSDIFAIGTAKNVAANYSAPVEVTVLVTVGIAVVFCVAVWRVRRPASAPRRWQFLNCSVLLACWLIGLELAGNSFGFWQGNLEYSEWYYFCRTAGNAIVERPAGYSEENVDRVTAAYTGERGEMRPNIIMIMNESFADLQTIGSFETNEDYMPFIRSLAGQENVISGDLLVSTFGGGTATTEFEVLTGDTVAFLPFGTSPYQMYVKSATPGLVSGLEKQGYETVAMHPYRASSWNRQEVYARFGFEKQLYEDDFSEDAGRLRTYITDSADYQKIIELYENRQPDAPFFMFNVTMQNHGGYEVADFPADVHVTAVNGEDCLGEYPKADQYLTLMKRSDEALKILLDYFSACSQPTLIVLFGDHEPSVETSFYEALYGTRWSQVPGEQKRYSFVTPYLIWSNYERDAGDLGDMSAFMLGSQVLRAAGMEAGGFGYAVERLRGEYPMVHSMGLLTRDGQFLDVLETGTLDLSQTVKEYHTLQYYRMFEEKPE